MSDRRSRNGGRWMRATFNRKYRSDRNRPSATARSRSWFVAATTRTSTGMGRLPPRRWTSRLSMARRTFACAIGPVLQSSVACGQAASGAGRYGAAVDRLTKVVLDATAESLHGDDFGAVAHGQQYGQSPVAIPQLIDEGQRIGLPASRHADED